MSKRILQINAEIQKYVNEIIAYELQNPLITGIISVLRVETTSDLSISKLYLSIFTKDDKEEVFNQIKHSAGYIRRLLADKLDIRKVPYIEFYMDKSAEYKENIDNIIEQINDKKD